MPLLFSRERERAEIERHTRKAPSRLYSQTVRLVLKMYRVISSCCKENRLELCVEKFYVHNFVLYVMGVFFLCNMNSGCKLCIYFLFLFFLS